MQRRSFLTALGAAAPAALNSAFSASRTARPNVLFIAVDDMNDWIGCLGGHPQVRTPNMDRLARRGVLFTNAHCQAPICNPSRTSVMTGIRPSTTGVYENNTWFRKTAQWKDVETLPQNLARNGYQTAGVGKLYHEFKKQEADGQVHDPDIRNEFQVHGPRLAFGPMPAQRISYPAEKGGIWIDWGAFPEREEETYDWQIAEWAIQFLRRSRKEPFFLGVGFYRPHVPMYAPKKWFELYPEDQVELPPFLKADLADIPAPGRKMAADARRLPHDWVVENKRWRELVRAYLACVSYVDHQIGRLLNAVEATGLAKDTLIVLWGDNGWHLGEKEHWAKWTLWERSTRVPLIISGPGISKGQVCRRPVELLDMYPTLADLCGASPPGGLEGISLRPWLKNANAKRDRPAITSFGKGNHAIRSERYRYIRYADGSREFYDHQTDAHEYENQAENPRYRTVIEELSQWLPRLNADPC